jgi:hypothetical protein
MQAVKSQCTNNETDTLRTNNPTTASAASAVKMYDHKGIASATSVVAGRRHPAPRIS